MMHAIAVPEQEAAQNVAKTEQVRSQMPSGREFQVIKPIRSHEPLACAMMAYDFCTPTPEMRIIGVDEEWPWQISSIMCPEAGTEKYFRIGTAYAE